MFSSDNLQSDHIFAKKDLDVSADKILENQLTLLENICIKVKETLLVRSYYDLLSRYFKYLVNNLFLL